MAPPLRYRGYYPSSRVTGVVGGRDPSTSGTTISVENTLASLGRGPYQRKKCMWGWASSSASEGGGSDS